MSTWRSDLVAMLMTVLQEQADATPTKLRRVYSSRPGGFGELPVAYIGDRDEVLHWDSGTQTRTSNPNVVLVDNYRDSVQVGDLLDELVDLLVSRFTDKANVTRIPGATIQLVRTRDHDIKVDGENGSTWYRAVDLIFGETTIMEGRD